MVNLLSGQESLPFERRMLLITMLLLFYGSLCLCLNFGVAILAADWCAALPVLLFRVYLYGALIMLLKGSGARAVTATLFATLLLFHSGKFAGLLIGPYPPTYPTLLWRFCLE